MNEQANKILIELLQKAVSGIDAAVSFSQAQIPQVIHQLLMWNMARSLFMFAIGVILTFTGIKIIRSFHKMLHRTQERVITAAQKDYESGKDWTRYSAGSSTTSISFDTVTGSGPIIYIATAILSAVVFVCWLCLITNIEWLKIWLAPKLYLLEYAASLIK